MTELPADSRKALPITVVIPVYNRRDLLPAVVASVTGQEGFRVEHVLIVDDCSTDGSADVAAALGVEVLRLPVNGGAAAARNAGLERVTTDWVAFLDSDDAWRPNLLATLWPATDGRVLVSGSAVLSAGGRPLTLIGPSRPPGRLLRSPRDVIVPENRVVTSSTIVRADVARALGGFDVSLRYSEDLDLWVRVLREGTGWADATPTITYNRGTSSKSQDTHGVDVARAGIVARYTEAGWWRPADAEQYLGGMYWDAARTALRARAWATARSALLNCMRNPHRIRGLAACMGRHRRLRRRLTQLPDLS